MAGVKTGERGYGLGSDWLSSASKRDVHICFCFSIQGFDMANLGRWVDHQLPESSVFGICG
jgi:hypothetical protein